MGKVILLTLITLSVLLLLPIPINRMLLNPVIRYLKGAGSPQKAEERAAVFPLYSAILSLVTWTIGGGIVGTIYNIKLLGLSSSNNVVLFMGILSIAFASSFVHFHLMRQAMAKIRIRIAEETGGLELKVRYPILPKLLVSFTLLIALALLRFAGKLAYRGSAPCPGTSPASLASRALAGAPQQESPTVGSPADWF